MPHMSGEIYFFSSTLADNECMFTSHRAVKCQIFKQYTENNSKTIMRSCYVCGAENANVRFPKNKERLELWTKSLDINGSPSEHVRICSGHFQSCEFTVKNGRKFLDVHAVPSKHVYPGTSVISKTDHNYAKGMGTDETVFPPEILILLLFSLLLLFDYFLTVSEAPKLPTNTSKVRG